MNRFLLFLSVFSISNLWAQVPSSCNVPSVMYDAYERDIKNMSLRQMQATASPDWGQIEIPAHQINPIAEGMAAVFNSIALLPEADSVYNLYCVHDLNGPYQNHFWFVI